MTVVITRLAPDACLKKEFFLQLERSIDRLLDECGLTGAEVGIIIAEDSYLHRLNKEHRAIDSTTDVLSFCYRDQAEEEQPGGAEFPLGDIYISQDRALEQAEAAGHDLEQELLILVLHGMLHLLGYDHGKKEEAKLMREKEKDLLARFFRSEMDN